MRNYGVIMKYLMLGLVVILVAVVVYNNFPTQLFDVKFDQVSAAIRG